MPELVTGQWHRLIGGDRVRVDAVDEESGFVAVTLDDGSAARMALSAFVGASVETAGKPSTAAGDTVLDFNLDDFAPSADTPGERDGSLELPVIDLEDDYEELSLDEKELDAALGELQEGDEGNENYDDEDYEEEEDYEEDEEYDDVDGYDGDDGLDDEVDPVGDAGGANDGDGSDGLTREEGRSMQTRDDAHYETAELPLDQPNEERPVDEQGGGLPPLMLGMLLGMIVLAGAATALVLMSRISSLESSLETLRAERLELAAAVEAQRRPAHESVPPPAAVDLGPLTERLDGQQRAAAERDDELKMLRQQVEGTLKGLEERVAAVDRRQDELEAAGQRPVAQPPAAVVQRSTPATKPSPATKQPPASGSFVVIVASFATRTQAEQELKRLSAAGMELNLREAQINGKRWYRLQAEGFSGRSAAQAYTRDIASRYGIKSAWVTTR